MAQSGCWAKSMVRNSGKILKPSFFPTLNKKENSTTSDAQRNSFKRHLSLSSRFSFVGSLFSFSVKNAIISRTNKKFRNAVAVASSCICQCFVDAADRRNSSVARRSEQLDSRRLSSPANYWHDCWITPWQYFKGSFFGHFRPFFSIFTESSGIIFTEFFSQWLVLQWMEFARRIPMSLESSNK